MSRPEGRPDTGSQLSTDRYQDSVCSQQSCDLQTTDGTAPCGTGWSLTTVIHHVQQVK